MGKPNPANDELAEADSGPGLTDRQRRDIARADLSKGKAPDINPVHAEIMGLDSEGDYDG